MLGGLALAALCLKSTPKAKAHHRKPNQTSKISKTSRKHIRNPFKWPVFSQCSPILDAGFSRCPPLLRHGHPVSDCLLYTSPSPRDS